MKNTSFLRQVTTRFLLTLPLKFRGIILIPILTGLYSQEVYGAWLQVILITDISSHLISLNLGAAIVRFLSAAENQKKLIKSVFTVTFLLSLLFIGVVYSFSNTAATLLFGSPKLKSILMISTLWIALHSLTEVALSALRAREQIGTVSSRQLMSAIWMIAAALISLWLNLDIHRFIAMCLVGDFLLLLWILFQCGVAFPFMGLTKSFKEVKKYLSFSIPLTFSSLFLWLTRSLDRLLIVHFMSLAAASVYGVSFQLANLLFAFLRPVNFVLFPKVSNAWNESSQKEVDQFFSQALTYTLVVGIPVIVGIAVLSDDVIQILAGGKYRSSYSLIVWLLLSCLISMIYQNHLYIVHLIRKTYHLPAIFIISALLNLLMGLFFVPQMGLIGAAISRTAALLFMASAVTIWARRHVSFCINWFLIIKVWASAVMMGIAIYLLPLPQTIFMLVCKILLGTGLILLLLAVTRVITISSMKLLAKQFVP
jgi:O-antigen/teichoic acid export membrane protein